MAKTAEECLPARIDQCGRILPELPVEVRLQDGVLCPEDVVPVKAEIREAGGETKGGVPVAGGHQIEQLRQLGPHGAGAKGVAWKLKGIDR
ncbi:hypothetical protein OKA04_12790 [Luteolibacter flavescens]|uniref:Uncharacterized protein n=1 Tax=Luteolibacter flavescens TaxID=1859460 RepID=A0ABT3FPV5_9BACT|nr:hypothetical protein [Luteolibacter flavescens]MCW1885608.1 hypothetical protein [Luteolibacter flavescens]